MAAAAIPLIMAGGGALGSFLGRPRVPEAGSLESRAFEEQIGASREQRGAFRQLRGIGLPALGQATSFFGNVVRDPREALAPEANIVAEGFRGAEQRIRSTTRGGVRELALAQLPGQVVAEQNRNVGAIRSNAAAQLANIGIPAATAGAGATSGFGQVGAALQTGRIQQTALQGALGQQAGQSVGNFIADMIQNQGSKNTGGNATGGSKSTGPNARASSVGAMGVPS